MISEKLKNVILKTLNLANFDFKDETLANQVPGWDSLTHISVIIEVEKAYSIRFKMQEIIKLKNIGELQNIVDSKTAVQQK